MNSKDGEHFESDEVTFRELLTSAGRGPRLSDEARSRISANVEAAWKQALERDAGHSSTAASNRARRRTSGSSWAGSRRQPMRMRWLATALAASVVAIVTAMLVNEPTIVAPANAREFATITVAEGSVATVREDQRLRLEGSAGGVTRVGDRIETSGDGRLALRLPEGYELRLNNDTTIEIRDSSTVDLVAGMLYFDAPPSAPRTEFTVLTDYGSVEHVGTQYIAALADDGLIVRVREGAARVTTGAIDGTGQEHGAVTGQELRVSESGSAEVLPFALDDSAWTWAQELARTGLDGPRTVLALLEWAARQSGRSVRVDSDAARDSAAAVVMNQAVDGLSPTDLLTVIRSTTDFEVSESSTTLTVALR